MHGSSRLAYALAAAALVSSCSLSSSDNSKSRITIQIDRETNPALLALAGFSPLSGVTPPNTVPGFTCLGVNVMGEGIPPIQHSCGCTGTNCNCGQQDINTYSTALPAIIAQTTYCSYPGVTSLPITNTPGLKTVNLNVPSGPQRVVQMVGILDSTTGGVCDANQPLGNDDGGQANYYEIGRVLVDLFSSQAVTVPDTWDTLPATAQVTHQLNCGGSGGGYRSVVESESSLAAYWPLNESVLGNASISGNQQSLFNTLNEPASLTVTTGPLIDPGDSGQNFALRFSGSPSDVATDPMNGNFTTTQATVEVWVNFPSGSICSNSTIFQLGVGNNHFLLYCESIGALGIEFDNNDQIAGVTTSGLPSLYDGIWHHVVATWSSPSSPGVPSIYVDGTDYTGGGSATTLGPFTFTQGEAIEISDVSTFLPAGTSISNLAVYTSAFTLPQAQDHYHAAGY